MKVITQRQQIQGIAQQWRDHSSVHVDPVNHKRVQTKLDALDLDTATAAEVDAIIPGWIDLRCHECGLSATAVVEVGEEPDYESSTAHLCFSCAEEAFRQLFNALTR